MIWDFRKIRGTLFWGRSYYFRVLYLGPLFSETPISGRSELWSRRYPIGGDCRQALQLVQVGTSITRKPNTPLIKESTLNHTIKPYNFRYIPQLRGIGFSG